MREISGVLDVTNPLCLPLAGGCQAYTHMTSHDHHADILVCAFYCMDNSTVQNAGGRGSRRLLFDAMPDLLYSGDTEFQVSVSFTHLCLPPQACLYPQVIFISAATSIYLNLERRETCYMCMSVYRVVYFFQRTGGS